MAESIQYNTIQYKWFNLIKSILEIYNLPSIFSLFNQQMSKVDWKRALNNAVHGHIEAKWRADLTGKSSLKYINSNSLKEGKNTIFGQLSEIV